jgi:hypothetical protein
MLILDLSAIFSACQGVGGQLALSFITQCQQTLIFCGGKTNYIISSPGWGKVEAESQH